MLLSFLTFMLSLVTVRAIQCTLIFWYDEGNGAQVWFSGTVLREMSLLVLLISSLKKNIKQKAK